MRATGQGGGASDAPRQDIASIFWGAAGADSDERTPELVVRHALACLGAFDEGKVQSKKTGKPLTLMQLLADIGLEENLVYASPELARGEPFDERSLVFTIGVLVFERLTDRHPFGTPDNPERVARIRRYEMGSGVNFFPSVPKELRTILMRAMGPFPEERYRGLKDLRADLERFAGQPARRVAAEAKRPKFFDAPTVVAPPILDFDTGEDEVTPVDTELPGLQPVTTLELTPEEQEEAQGEEVPAAARAPAAQASAAAPARAQRRGEPASAPASAPIRPATTRPGAPSQATLDALARPPAPAAATPAPPTTPKTPTPPPIVAEPRVMAPTPPEFGKGLPAPAPKPTLTPAEAAGNRLSAHELFSEIPEPSAARPLPVVPDTTARVRPLPSAPPVAGSARVGPAPRRLAPLVYALAGALVATGVFLLITWRWGQREPERGGAVVKPALAAKPEARAAAPRPAPRDEAKPQPEPQPKQPKQPKPVAKPEPEPKPKPEPKPAPKPVAKAEPKRAPAVGEAPEIVAGKQVGAAIRHCGVGEAGRKSLRVAAFVQASGKVVRSFANKKQGVSDAQLACIRKALAGLSLSMGWSEAGFIEWSLRIFGDRIEAAITGPPELKARVGGR